LVLVTDGRGNVGQAGQLQQAVAAILRAQPTTSLVLDSEQGYVRLGTAQEIARQLGAKYVRLDELRSDTITERVRQNLMIQP
jgi:magnesium chelatase subunit D